MLRRFLELTTRRFVFRRRLPASLGGCAFYASTEGGLKFLKPRITDTDPGLLDIAKQFITPGSIVWDVGANIGLFTFAAAGLAGPTGNIVAVEADPWLCGLLEKSISIKQSRAKIDLLSVAVSARAGTEYLVVARRARASNFLASTAGQSQAGGERARVEVRAVTLDSLLDRFPSPTFLKLDIEGMEAAALRASRRLLFDVRPIIYAENSDPELIPLLTSAGYECSDGWNFIAIPH